MEEIVCLSSPAKDLIRHGFFGPRAVSPSLAVLKEASLSSKGKDPILELGLIRQGFLGSIFFCPTLPVVALGLHSPAAASELSSQV